MMSATYPDQFLYVAGRWIGAGERETRPVISPSTGEVVARLPMATDADLDDALAAAERGFAQWRRTPAYARSLIVRRIGQLIREKVELYAQVTAHDLGKPLADGRREALTAAEMFEWAAEECRRSYGREIPGRSGGQSLTARLELVGPVAAFSPWNVPAVTPARKISGALAAGCSIILKAAEETPGAAVLIAQAAEAAGLPAGVLNLVFGDPAAISRRLLDSPVTKALTFTGSTRVGRDLAARAGAGLMRMTLELGGHAPVLVFDDIDPEAVADAAVVAKFRNSGQVCTSPTRFYVHKAIYRRFADRFVDGAKALRVGDPFDPEIQMGPVANERRLETMERLTADARGRGVAVAAGGARRSDRGYYWSPTVLTDAGDECLAANEEPFGPLALLTPVASLDEALTRANRTPQALAAYAFTHDSRIQAALREELNAGTVGVNHWQASWPETPFGGRGASGLGLEGGIEGLQAFQQVKFYSVT